MLLLWQLQLSLIQAVSNIIFKLINCNFVILALSVIFTQSQFTGSEATRFVQVNLELDGGSSASPFSVTVTPSEQSPVSAEGNIVCIIMC